MSQLADGKMDPMNMSFLLCLEVACLQACKSTTNMQFQPETHQFWKVIYHVCHGKGLRLFSGFKNQGCLQNGSTKRGSYPPCTSCHNFVVPDENLL